MKMLTTVAGACMLGLLAFTNVAQANVQELGAFDPAALKGSCPDKPCVALSRTTGYQAKIGDTRSPMAAPANGKIVAYTVAFGNPGKKQISYFEQKLGGTPSLNLAIINAPKKLRSRVVSSTPAFDPTPYFNSVASFALDKPMAIKKGQIVALTSTSWAPLLAVNQPATTSWRASRNKGMCDDVVTQTAPSGSTLARYYCLYKGVRLAYSATFVPDPTPAKTSR